MFSSHQCVTVSQDEAHLLERCSLLKVCVRARVCVCVCVLDNSAVAEPPTVRTFFISVRLCLFSKMNVSLCLYFREMFQVFRRC